ncbi:MAG: glucuronate isomerase [Limisphaerales bacterium]|nr:MAG: glucuronate isomerase [Limisphaerales bacterium]KAG0510271.1 MAG: glucuronate isomerase [Limisphaerales bacterium]TXT51846.1 MAG: glucuronate isomerase [Limisphaerales bacterium]
MPFIHDDFLLSTETARRLYHQFAAPEPILDYHCHLSPRDLAENRQFNNLFEIWLEGDHYKWRAMRSNGVAERFCTGDAEPFAKFQAWAATVPHTLRNPLYHWTHLELARYFGLTDLLDESNAARVWNQANEQLATPALSAQGILKKFRVTTLCTTDDPTDDLRHHESIAAQGLATRVLPAFRPDKALGANQPAAFNAWVDRLADASDTDIADFPDFLHALCQRVEYFHAHGCRLSDHGLNHCYADFCSTQTATAIFAKARNGQPVSPAEHAQFASFVMLFLGRLYAQHDWTMQLHLGALRSANTRLLRTLGPDTGFDSIGDWPQARALAAFLDRLDTDNSLPKTILYNLNPADNYAVATMLGNFQDGTVPGKVQLGSGWWFLDQKEAMEWQLNALSNLGLLSRFVGMVTDSRSFMSYPRHEYFRRVLCNLVGRDVEAGELPDDDALVGSLVRNLCHANARQYLSLPEAVAPEPMAVH